MNRLPPRNSNTFSFLARADVASSPMQGQSIQTASSPAGLARETESSVKFEGEEIRRRCPMAPALNPPWTFSVEARLLTLTGDGTGSTKDFAEKKSQLEGAQIERRKCKGQAHN